MKFRALSLYLKPFFRFHVWALQVCQYFSLLEMYQGTSPKLHKKNIAFALTTFIIFWHQELKGYVK